MKSLFAFFIFYCSLSFVHAQELNELQKLNQIADDYEKSYFEHYPETGLHLGKQNVSYDRFMDHSLQASFQWQKQEDAFLMRLQQLDIRQLQGTPQYQTYRLLKERLESSQAIRVCQDELWNINPLWGWHIMLGMIADKQPTGTVEYREAAIKRWRSFDQIVQDEMTNLQIGIQKGYTAPKSAVKRVISQIKLMVNAPVEKSPFFAFANRDNDPHFKQQMKKIIQTVINPALKRYATYLENDYLPQARNQVGVSALPNGKQCYQAKIQQNTTLKVSPEFIYHYGLEHRKKLSQEISHIGRQEFGVQDEIEIFRLAKEKTQHFFKSEQAILDYNQQVLAKITVKIPQWFSLTPITKGIIKPYPLHRAKTGAAGEYDRPSEDGSRAGIYYINTYNPASKSKITQEATLFHELIPGHHFQIALAMENKARHALEQYLWNDGYEEGWALYAERLADEMGLYEDNLSRLGMLSNESLRTARLVVDPGIHIMNWQREDAIAYLKKHTVLADDIIEAEVDRYIMLPAQATSYMLGKHEIESLRELAKKQLGEHFDIKEFHTQVLKNGCITLPMLRENILNWLEDMKSKHYARTTTSDH